MRVLDITADLGPGASLPNLEALVRGIRVAADVARDSDQRRVRRTATEQMKFPTDDELRAAQERLPGGDESSPRYKVGRHLKVRDRFRDDSRGGPPDMWFDYVYRMQRWKDGGKHDFALRAAGYDRLFESAPGPFLSNTVGLDVLDPDLYQALVADVIGQGLSDAIGVAEMRYSNPFFQRLFGRGGAEKTISATAQVIESVSTIGSTRKMAKADAEVAEGTVGHRVEQSELDVELKRLAVERERQALFADQIQNARWLEQLGSERVRRVLVENAVQRGQIDISDAIAELSDSDASALGQLGGQTLELEERHEDDDPFSGQS